MFVIAPEGTLRSPAAAALVQETVLLDQLVPMHGSSPMTWKREPAALLSTVLVVRLSTMLVAPAAAVDQLAILNLISATLVVSCTAVLLVATVSTENAEPPALLAYAPAEMVVQSEAGTVYLVCGLMLVVITATPKGGIMCVRVVPDVAVVGGVWPLV
jgi:hypothetical protein